MSRKKTPLLRKKKGQRRIYLDYAASTPVDRRVFAAMKPHFLSLFANAGSIHREGALSKKALGEAREEIAREIGAHPDEVIFTSGGTEANNLAVFGIRRAFLRAGKKMAEMHFVTSAIEHPSVLDCFSLLEEEGAQVSYAMPDMEGIISPEEILKHLRPNTALVSVMYANNEIGTIQPLHEISRAIREYARKEGIEKPLLHSDASQAILWLPCNVEKLGVDLLSLDGQKIYGPKGVGVLYHRRGARIEKVLEGGNQEQSLRPGTENVPLAIGFGRALSLISKVREKEGKRVSSLRDFGIEKILKEVPGAELNGSRLKRLPNNINISIPGIEGEMLVLFLDARGIAAGTRSACLADKGVSSYVVRSMGKDDARADSTLRISLGRTSTKKDIERVASALREIVEMQLGTAETAH